MSADNWDTPEVCKEMGIIDRHWGNGDDCDCEECLAGAVSRMGDALIAIAVRNGPRRWFSDGLGDYDPVHEATPSAADYRAAAIALGVL